MNHLNELINNKEIFFRFIAERFPVFTGANVFFRDIQFGIKFYFEKKDVFLKYPEAEKLAADFIAKLEENGDLTRYNDHTWKVNLIFKEEVVEEEPTEEEVKEETTTE